MNNYSVDGPIKLGKSGNATLITDQGHHLFVNYDAGKLTIHIESDQHGGYSKKSLATVTENGWVIGED